jgi:hypothetical protein
MTRPGPYRSRPGSPPSCCGFLPSRDAFAFTNAWPPGPAVTVPTPLRGAGIGIGNTAAGLCGGMIFAALDYWHAREQLPAARPEPGSPLQQYIVRRLIASWRIPAGVARYYQWMNLPDGDREITAAGGRLRTTVRGAAWRTIAVQWPRIRASLDDGIPAPLGLVTVASANPAQLRHNHQALAFGYDLSGREVTLRVYDPNSGQDDGVCIRFDASSPERATAFPHNLNLGWPVRGFFLVGYSPATPPPATPLPAAAPPATPLPAVPPPATPAPATPPPPAAPPSG